MTDTPALDCLRSACAALSEKSHALREWAVRQDGDQVEVTLRWMTEEVTVLVRGPDHPKAFGRTASFTFSIQMDEATALMSHELETGLGRFIESVRKADTGQIPLPSCGPRWEPGAGPPSVEPESDEPESDEPESDEPAVPMHVISQPQISPEDNHSREEWITKSADRAHAKHQDALNWAIYCALKCLDAGPYPHTELLQTEDSHPNAEAYAFLVEHLQSGFSLITFRQRFGAIPSMLCPEGYPLLLDFEALYEAGETVLSHISHPARLAVYRIFVYSPTIREALEQRFRSSFDGRMEHMDALMARF